MSVIKVTALAVCMTAGAVTLTGCKPAQLDDGYQFGDATAIAVEAVANAKELRSRWCDDGDRLSRTLLIGAVRAYIPAYPSDGICSDGQLLTALAEAAGVEPRPPDHAHD